MMRFLFVVLMILSISACSNVDKQPPYPGHAPQVTSQLQFRNNLAYLPGSNYPYTGQYETYYPNGSKRTTAYFSRGLRHGLTTTWDQVGHKLEELNYQSGQIALTIANAKQLYKSNRYNEAFNIYQNLANQNNTQAQFYLGYMYSHAQGTIQNQELAYFWFDKAAKTIMQQRKRS